MPLIQLLFVQNLILLKVDLALISRTRFNFAAVFGSGCFRAASTVPGLTSIHDAHVDVQALLQSYNFEQSDVIGAGVGFGQCAVCGRKDFRIGNFVDTRGSSTALPLRMLLR